MLNNLIILFIRTLNSNKLFFFFLSFFFLIAILNVKEVFYINYLLIIMHLIIVFLSSMMILKRGFNGLLVKSFGVFSLLAFGLMPILEILTNTIYWLGGDIDLFSRLKANLIVTIFIILFMIGFKVNFRQFAKLQLLNKPKLIFKKKEQLSFLLIIISCFIFLFYLYKWEIKEFFFWSVYGPDIDVDTKASFLIASFFLKPFIFNLGLYLFFFKGPYKFLGTLGLFIGIISAFPTGVPRFLAMALYLPLILHWFFVSLNSKENKLNILNLLFPNILILGVIFIFPTLNLFRFYADHSFVIDDFNYSEIISVQKFLDGHFDSYQMLTRGLNIGEINFGYGFLSSLLFFIPRSIWQDKDIGSGYHISYLSDLNLPNVSAPLILELYLNFWYLGVLFGGLSLGFLLSSIDKFFIKITSYKISFAWIIYFQSIGYFFLILRGSFLAAFAYFLSWILTWLVIIQLQFLIRYFITKQ